MKAIAVNLLSRFEVDTGTRTGIRYMTEKE